MTLGRVPYYQMTWKVGDLVLFHGRIGSIRCLEAGWMTATPPLHGGMTLKDTDEGENRQEAEL